jgi:capping protein alpha
MMPPYAQHDHSANKFPRNGRWRSHYLYTPSASTLTGLLRVDVHYYEDGNVRLQTSKPVSLTFTSSSAAEISRQIATAERKYQEDLNRAFGSLSEGAFKSLRRQLPITRQKLEWEKISGYRVSFEWLFIGECGLMCL